MPGPRPGPSHHGGGPRPVRGPRGGFGGRMGGPPPPPPPRPHMGGWRRRPYYGGGCLGMCITCLLGISALVAMIVFVI